MEPLILLTGFEPFEGAAVNPSTKVVTGLAHDPPAGVRLETLVLPVDTAMASPALLKELHALQPDILLSLGESRGSTGLQVERLAINLLDFRIPDNAGVQIQDEEIVAGGPAAYVSPLPARSVVEAIRAVGVPASHSLSAGSYLCNQVFYVALHWAATERPASQVGFIHVPSLPRQMAKKERPQASMALGTIQRGIRAALSVMVTRYRM